MASCGKDMRFYKDKGFEVYEYLKAPHKTDFPLLYLCQLQAEYQDRISRYNHIAIGILCIFIAITQAGRDKQLYFSAGFNVPEPFLPAGNKLAQPERDRRSIAFVKNLVVGQ